MHLALLLASALAAAPAGPAGTAAASEKASDKAARAPPKARVAQDPAATIREAEAKVRAALDAGASTEQLGVLAAEYLDYQDLARRSLGRHWARLPRADRAALTAALRALLEATYLTRLHPGAAGRAEVREVRRTPTEADLHVVASAGEQQVPIELRLQRSQDGRWRVYDATVAGLALLEGYQEQFPQLLELGGMKRLLAQLEQERQAQRRLHEPPAGGAAASPAPAKAPGR